MSHQFEVLRSLASTTLQQGRGVNANNGRRQPVEPLELYDMEACPYCRLVREALTDLDLDVMIYPCPKGGDRYRPLVERLGGKQQFPYLMDPNTGAAMYESADIVAYLYREYGRSQGPSQLKLKTLRTAAAFAASVPRGTKGMHHVPARTPAKPLELFSFDASPYARLVRERLTEMQIPYLLRQVGRDQWKDWLLPVMRKRLAIEYTPTQRNRVNLMQRAGRIAVPYLVDANTGVEMFESEKILAYLEETYGE